jgi:hypothetical protein
MQSTKRAVRVVIMIMSAFPYKRFPSVKFEGYNGKS